MNILLTTTSCTEEKLKWSQVGCTHGLLNSVNFYRIFRQGQSDEESLILSVMMYNEGSEEDADWWENGKKKKVKESI